LHAGLDDHILQFGGDPVDILDDHPELIPGLGAAAERLKQLVQTCVEEQIAAGNTNVFSPDRRVDDHTLVFAGVRYLPNGPEIDVSLGTESTSL
jgi:hypothetical protein